MSYDLLILGGGPAGYFAAERATEAGFRTLLLEERNLGGVCLNEGCIPTKCLLHAAKIATSALYGEELGIYAENLWFDHATTLARKNKVVQKLTSGVASSLKQRKVDAIRTHAVIKKKTDKNFALEVNGEIYEGARLLVCTGSEPIVPPLTGLNKSLESGFVITSREILDIEDVPKKLVIVGGGVIGLELANYFAVAGAEVTVVEMLPEVGGVIDADIAKTLRTSLEKLGIRFLLSTKAEWFDQGKVNVRSENGAETIIADKALLCIGRKPKISGAGFEELGIYTENGAVVTDARMRTNVPGVWAAGDVNGKMMLAHTAYREAAVAVNDMAGIADAMRYDAIPQIVYTSPEAACVGETEASARSKGYIFDKSVLPLQYSGRYVSENMEGDGFMKMLTERRTGRIIGFHIVGSYASEIVLSAAIMIGAKWTAEAALKIVYPHPTVGEILRDALIDLTERGNK